MRDENSVPGLITGYADADQTGEIKLQLLKQNREAVERKLDQIEQSLTTIAQRWEDKEITLAQLEQHKKEAAGERKRLNGNLQLLDLYIARLERLRD